ncbi:hypothetical protein FSP39_001628 [Pinctada imbricata]|uniref:AIG1-type G domain-containing protein n=1 Tax=Pinctada imbricata TaxID=66713 RepID=A0AA89BYB5_PINIB|nr:hypothetical protein FSP39_001628 [Pinctada imbricata]
MANQEVQREIVKCIGMTSPGPHAFVLVLNLSRFTQEEEDSVNHFTSYFGDDVYDYMIVLFTRKDDLDYEGLTLDDHVRKVPKPLKDILRRCGGRKIAFNNRASGAKRDQQVQGLLDIVDDIIQQNRGKCYTNDMYDEAETVMLQKEAEIRRARKERKQQERRQIEREVESKYRKELARHKKDEEDMSLRVAELESERDYHDSKANKLNNEIDKLRDKIADDKRHGKSSTHLERKLRDLEDELDKLKSKNKGSDVHRELKKMREELDKTKKRAKKMQKEKEQQMEMRLQEQERRFAEMQKPREEVRQNVEQGNGLDSLVSGIVSVGKLIWTGISKLF